jgi:hypothetical protein
LPDWQAFNHQKTAKASYLNRSSHFFNSQENWAEFELLIKNILKIKEQDYQRW